MSSSTIERLTKEELQQAAAILGCTLKKYGVKFGIIGGAATGLISAFHRQQYRGTKDIDIVIQPTAHIDAESLSEALYTNHPEQFVKEDAGYGQFVPAIRLADEATKREKYVEVEIFDVEAWPTRPQYDLSKPDNDRVMFKINQSDVYVLSPRWLLREKLLSQKQRQGSAKEGSDIDDIEMLLEMVGAKALTLTEQEHIEALRSLLEKRPDLRVALEAAIECSQVFQKG